MSFHRDTLSDSQRFQVSEARDTLALWRQNRDFPGNISTERALADLAGNLLAIIDSLDADTPVADVPMVCTACRTPVLRAFGGWYHVLQEGARQCGQAGPVMPMVAAGNEKISSEEQQP